MKHEETKPWPQVLLEALRGAALVLVVAMVLWVTAGPAAAAGIDARKGETMVIPMGRAVGIKLFSDGVIVVGMSDIATEQGAVNPARECGLKEGDIITHINSEEVDSIEEVRSVLQDLEGETMSIRALRGEKQVQMTAQGVQCSTDGSYKLGAWIRDSMAGIGTMTFYQPSTGTFGALGHGISDIDTALLMPLEDGSIMYAEVAQVQKGVAGTPGQLQGAFEVSNDLGELWANTNCGVFGTLTDESLLGDQAAVPVASRDEVQTGAATILSNINGSEVKEYTIEITKIFAESATDSRDFMIRVTDPELLQTTGGIVQGQSGSPILQNGKLIGAVTHVLVNDPTSGYAISGERMLSQAAQSGE